MYLLHKEISPQSPIIVPPAASVRSAVGEVRGVLRDAMGNVVQDTGWVKNGYTNYGRDYLPYTSNYMALGTSGVPNDATFTQLPGYLTHQTFGSSSWNNGAPLHDAECLITERFEPGAATGTIQEVGLLHSNDANTLATRAVIPPIVKGADNALDMYYRVHQYPDLNEYTGSVVIDGVTYDYRARLVELSDLRSPLSAGVYTGADYVNSGHTTRNIPADFQANQPSGGQNMYRRNVIWDYVARNVTWEVWAFLTTCNYVDGIQTIYTRIRGGSLAGHNPCIGCEFTATDGDNIGGGIHKTEYDYCYVTFELGWDAVTP